jgi:DNA polymerase
VENVTQAIARDLLRDAMLNVDAAGYDIAMHVHDEIVLDEEPGTDMREIMDIMRIVPAWAEGLPMDVDAFECGYYHK